MSDEGREVLEAVLEYSFQRPELLDQALTHSSRKREAAAGREPDNEPLEFLGDSVLGLVASEFLWRTFPEWETGRLAKSKARLVSTASLVIAAQKLGLGRHLRLGRGEEKTGGREKRNLLADAFEAVVAAIYLDAGLDAARKFLERSLLQPAVAEWAATLGEGDHKSSLQEWLQHRGSGPVEYRLIKEAGPDHRKIFSVEVRLGRRRLSAGEGRTKKDAEQEAARAALERLHREEEIGSGDMP